MLVPQVDGSKIVGNIFNDCTSFTSPNITIKTTLCLRNHVVNQEPKKICNIWYARHLPDYYQTQAEDY